MGTGFKVAMAMTCEADGENEGDDLGDSLGDAEGVEVTIKVG